MIHETWHLQIGILKKLRPQKATTYQLMMGIVLLANSSSYIAFPN